MACFSFTLLPPTRLSGDGVQALVDAWDVGAYNTLGLVFLILASGSAGTLIVEHSPVLREESFVPLSGATVTLSGAVGPTPVLVTQYFRYLRWRYTGATGGPVAAIEAVVKE